MLGDITVVDQIYIACGYTDMRKSIDGLAALVQEHFSMDPYEPALFLISSTLRITLYPILVLSIQAPNNK